MLMSPCSYDYMLCFQALIVNTIYITGNHMLKSSYILFELKYSTLVSDLYGLMQCILYLIFITAYFYMNMSLVNTMLSQDIHYIYILYIYAVL